MKFKFTYVYLIFTIYSLWNKSFFYPCHFLKLKKIWMEMKGKKLFIYFFLCLNRSHFIFSIFTTLIVLIWILLSIDFPIRSPLTFLPSLPFFHCLKKITLVQLIHRVNFFAKEADYTSCMAENGKNLSTKSFPTFFFHPIILSG